MVHLSQYLKQVQTNNKLYYIKNNALIEKEIPKGMYDIPELNKFLLTNCNGDFR